jgi:hypothetical protein
LLTLGIFFTGAGAAMANIQSLLLGLLLTTNPGAEPADELSVAADEATLKSAGLAIDGPGLLEIIRQRTPSETERERLANLVRQLGDPLFIAREQASTDLRTAARAALPFLRPALHDPDPEIAQRARRCLEAIEASPAITQMLAAIRLTGFHNPPGTAGVLLNYLPFAEDELLEEEALTVLGQMGMRQNQADPALLAAIKDSAPLRRAAAGLALGRVPDGDVWMQVRPLLTDADPRVRFRTAQGLIAGRHKEAVPALVELIAQAPPALAWNAEDLLNRIAGEQAPAVALGPAGDNERRAAREAWTAWWRANGEKLDLAGIDAESRQLGLTLIVAFDGYNNGQGRVWEIGRDGKTRWEINGVNRPVDAQVVPGNRVLIAEQGGRQVSERDLQGQVVWQHAVSGNLVSCQRLPGGNTFIATNTHLYEVGRDGKTAVTYTGHKGTVYNARKLRNGNILYISSDEILTELDPRGKTVRTFKVSISGIGLLKPQELPGGRFLVGQVPRVVELDAQGNVVWEAAQGGLTAVQRLANGNILGCSNTSKRVVELDRTGKLLWEEKLTGTPFQVHRR